LLRGAFARDDHYRPLATAQLWFAILITLGVAALLVLFELGPAGLIQRLLVVVMVTWALFLAVNLRRVEAPAQAT
jgi:hypothetical protein